MTNHFDDFDERSELIESLDAKRDSASGCQTETGQAETSCFAQRDQFELLSAYLDGEVTATEKRQVEEWLAADPKTQRLYGRLLALRQNLQLMPIASSEQTVDQLVDRVTARIERQPRRLAWGGLVAAGLLIGALFNAMPQDRYTPSIADSRSSSDSVPSEGLMIALNRPPIDIPNTTLLDQLDSVDQQLNHQSIGVPKSSVSPSHKIDSTTIR